ALLKLVDEDTAAFNAILAAFRLAKNTPTEKQLRKEAIQNATRYAIEIPLQVMQLSFQSFEICQAMVKDGNPNSITDAAVGALCARTAIHAAYLNVKINTAGLNDKRFVAKVLKEGKQMLTKANRLEKEILKLANQKM
ncbi:MAG TPA: glutamate formimidoyltransferase, partial [Saprospiraceae bacterium]|nr:glutamate formimidoyltransferase [Saprospiraceae bacterium]